MARQILLRFSSLGAFLRLLAVALAAAGCVIGSVRLAGSAEHGDLLPFTAPVPPVEERLRGAAARVANLSPAECSRRLREADAQKVFERQGPQHGIATPLRVVRPLDGVVVKVAPKTSPFGLLDCRQALLWLELVPLLHRHGVVDMRVDSFYRRGARLPGKKSKKSQHAYGLATDIVSLGIDPDGKGPRTPIALDVEADFGGARGEPPCGPDAKLHLPEGATTDQVERARLLRDFVCDLARGGWFHHILTPNHDHAHRNHLHLDIKRDNRWYSIN